MTSPEIQQAAFLDLLFENRNKLYGAYTLRKYYSRRLVIALCISVLFVASVLSIVLKNIAEARTPFIEQAPDELIVHTQIIPEALKPPDPPKAVKPQPPSAPVAQQQYTQIRITTDPITTAVPTQTDLQSVAISNTTIAGVPEPPIATAPSESTKPAPHVQPEAALINAAPQFPGGTVAWASFLSRNLRAPETLDAAEKKTVVVKFLVSEDGTVTGFEVVQSGGAAFDDEVIRVLKKMPKWKPALKNGVPIAVPFTQPVTFIAMGD